MKKMIMLGLCLGAAILMGQTSSSAADLKVGDKAPEFEAKDDQGKVWKSTDYLGKKTLVVFFYPAALTGG